MIQIGDWVHGDVLLGDELLEKDVLMRVDLMGGGGRYSMCLVKKTPLKKITVTESGLFCVCIRIDSEINLSLL